ncbi:dihydrolipoyl dehydrogenase [Altericroceibacterium endophyticum]|uniref:Dihydrolipoyl dehydrogenase n=1 Tax=Altericroceibacterium endophyticum TaxID=1808508 RepID=A0A6I4T8S1_9SPHN|nr:dihydrolipoyl dehydrogenase [Altericroceibacterium endophyticum]MXO66155.1 dihydrolipoyl dehydrogenase [Altericroceibacterium endophyticum]
MTLIECDVAIIGAGTAGLAAERNARHNGATTRLIDPEFAGTVCASVGCMPSKLLIAAGDNAHNARKSDVFGVSTGDITIDGKAVMRRVREERDKFVAGTRHSIARLPDDVKIQAKARFISQTRLALDNGDEVQARTVVIATGSAPAIPEPFQGLGDLALTNQNIFEIEDLPRTLAVIGGGAIGLELAQAMARLGVEVSLFDRAETLGNAPSADVEASAGEVMGREIDLHLGVDVTATRDGDTARIDWSSGEDSGSAKFDRVLLALGRPPNVAELDLENADLELDDHGVPRFNRETMQCGDAPVFIAGDSNADVTLLHEASTEGAVAGRNAVAYPAIVSSCRTPFFAITFTDPPLAVIGDAGEESLIGCASYEDQGRAKVEARADGCVRIFASAPHGTITGAALFAPGADHMAHLLMLAIMEGKTASELLEMPFYHPTLEEGLKPALRDICKVTPVPLPQDRDKGDPPGA